MTHGARSFEVGDADRGTPPSVWRAWRPPLPPLRTDTWRRVVVLAAHPDDDVLGVGGLLGRLQAQGADIVGVQLTDGSAAYPDSPSVTPGQLARIRIAEACEAYARLALDPPQRLSLPDGQLAAHEDTLVDLLRPFLRPGDRWLAPWRSDRHPDHEAAGRAAARVCADEPTARMWEYPVWMWHWATPGGREVNWEFAHQVSLTPAERHAKRRAADCFRSQLVPLSDHPADAPVVPPFAFERLVTQREVVFRGA